MIKKASEIKNNSCYHCGEPCDTVDIKIEEKQFCCQGCKMVYEILHQNELNTYYQLENQPGTRVNTISKTDYGYLDDPEVLDQLITYQDDQMQKFQFFFPQIHCSSCIWLLENLFKLHNGVINARVNFLKKEGLFTIDPKQITLRGLVELLASIGYPPEINLSQLEEKKPSAVSRSLYYKLGIAGFAFGNIMMLSFPEYLGLHQTGFQYIFGYINLLLAIPVVFYCGRDYLVSAWYGLQQKHLNMDVPISLGILTLFIRSSYEIISNTGAGYMDSLAGLVFFLLAGKWFQQKTYYSLNFERDYKSYFPIAVTKKVGSDWASIPLNKIEIGDILLIRNQELIPTDGRLTKGAGQIDYSFVTGEAVPIPKAAGDKLFAGGKQLGAAIEMTVTKKVEQSYLTQLWNDSAFNEQVEGNDTRLANTISKYFTFVILGIAITTLLYWIGKDINLAFNAFTAVLIIACPCAIALAIPFTYGNVLRILSRHQFFLKNVLIIEGLQNAKHLIFDKTGTLTENSDQNIQFLGNPLSPKEQSWVKSLTQQSSHPLSRKINTFLDEAPLIPLENFQEIPGKGILANIDKATVKVGSKKLMGQSLNGQWAQSEGVFVSINDEVKGCFAIQHPYRKGLKVLIKRLQERFQISLLSGDNDLESNHLLPYFKSEDHLHFNQSPQQKLDYVKDLQQKGQEVIMVGDGLNDAGALKQSNVGIVITENINNFTPASDAILAASSFSIFPDLLKYIINSRKIIFATYLLALIYNVVGLSYAVQGTLSPVIAAILMPLSSITVVVFGVGMSTVMGLKKK